MSEIQNLNTNVDSGNQKNTGLSDKNNITPESIDIVIDLSCNDCLSKYVHVKSVNDDRYDSADTKYTKLCDHVNTVAKNYHNCHDQNAVVNDSFYAKQCYHCEKQAEKYTAQSLFHKKL